MAQALADDQLVVLTARFASKCAACWGQIPEGSQFKWAKLQKRGWHTDCPAEIREKPEGFVEQGRVMRSRFGGECANCHRRFDVDDPIRYLRPNAFHEACPPVVAKDPKASDVDLSSLPYGSYRFAISDGQKLRFLRVDLIPPVDSEGSPRPYGGNVYVREQTGAGFAGERLGRQLVGHTYVGKGAELLRAILVDPEDAARRYGLELGECSVCGATLTNPESRELGIGPVCRKRFTWTGRRVVYQPAEDVEVAS